MIGATRTHWCGFGYLLESHVPCAVDKYGDRRQCVRGRGISEERGEDDAVILKRASTKTVSRARGPDKYTAVRGAAHGGAARRCPGVSWSVVPSILMDVVVVVYVWWRVPSIERVVL